MLQPHLLQITEIYEGSYLIFPSHYNIKKRTLQESQSEQDLMATKPTQKLCSGKDHKNRGSEMHDDILLYVWNESRINDLLESRSFLITGVKSEKSYFIIFISPEQNKYIKIRTISHTTYTQPAHISLQA